MKKVKDPGLIYMQKLDINPAKNYGQVFDGLTRLYGKDKMEALMDFLNETPAETSYIEYYDGFFKDPDMAFTFTTLCIGDYYRKVCNLIHGCRDLFGSKILEIGCGNGVLTGFLALTFPEAEITAIDTSQNAVEATRHTLSRLGVQNVKLLHTSMEDYTDPEIYDTVFESLSISDSCGTFQENDNLSIEEKALSRAPGFASYTVSVSRHLSENGSFIMVEPSIKGSYYPGLFRSLLDHSLSMDPKSFKIISTTETGEMNNRYLFGICRKGNQDTFWPALTETFKLV